MKKLIEKLTFELVAKLLNGKKITLKDLGKQEVWEYPNNTETLSLPKKKFVEPKDGKKTECLTREEIALLKELNLISEYLEISWDPRSEVWIVNPEKIDLLKDVLLHFKIERSYKILKEQEELHKEKNL